MLTLCSPFLNTRDATASMRLCEHCVVKGGPSCVQSKSTLVLVISGAHLLQVSVAQGPLSRPLTHLSFTPDE